MTRLNQITASKQSKIPDQIASDLTNQFIADIHAKARAEADHEVKELLVVAAEQSENESLMAQIEGLRRDHESMILILSQSKSQVVQLNDLVKALRAEVSVLEAKPSIDCGHAQVIAARDARINDLEQRLMQAPPSPPPPQVFAPNPIPMSFEFEPIRNENGFIKSVTAKPVYRN